MGRLLRDSGASFSVLFCPWTKPNETKARKAHKTAKKAKQSGEKGRKQRSATRRERKAGSCSERGRARGGRGALAREEYEP